MATICPNCKNNVSPTSNFCEHCGNPIQIAPEDDLVVERQHKPHYQNLIEQRKTEKKPHQSVDAKTLKRLLAHLEQGRGGNFEEAKARLMEMRSLESVEPLWKISQKSFAKDETKKAAKEILTETGSDKLVDLIIDKYLLGEEAIWAISILAEEKNEKSLEWLAERTGSIDFTVELCALEAVRRIGTKKAIPYLVKNASGDFIEDSVSPTGGNLLLGLAIATLATVKQSIEREMVASLLTAPFLPFEMVMNAPKLVQKAQTFIYRIDVLTEIIESFGFEELDKIFYEPQFMKSISKLKKMAVESTIASCYLRLGKHHPNIPTVIQNVIFKKKMNPGDEISAAILTDEMIRFNITQKSDLYLEPIRESLRDKGKITRQSSIASVFYQNYQPCLQEALQEAKIKDNRFIPALSYCAYMHDNFDAKNTLDYLERSGNSKIAYAIGNWKEILAEWKRNDS